MKQIYNKIEYDISEKYSFKDFTKRQFLKDNMDNLIIYGSCFSNECPDTIVFPEKMTGTTFIKCNLDNCVIPDGNTVIDCTQRRYCVQNDLNDWIVDEFDNPVEPINKKIFVKMGLPVPDPMDIPVESVEEAVDLLKEASVLKESLTLETIIK